MAIHDRESRSRAVAVALVATVASCLVIPGLVQALAELRRGGHVQALDVVSTRPSRPALRAFEAELERRSLLVAWARESWAPLVDRTLERGNGQVVMGSHSWLFYRDALRWVTGPPFAAARARALDDGEVRRGEPLRAILDTHRQLAQRGIELVVLPTPAKATLYPERARRGAPGESAPTNPGFGAFLAALEDAGIEVLDPTPALLAAKADGALVFLERDTHWSPHGMRIAARLVAAWIERSGALASPEIRRAPFDHRLVEFESYGDLVEMLAYPPSRSGYEPMPVLVDQVIATRRGRPPIATEAPVLLLGDSATLVYSREELGLGRRGGLGEQLADLLRLPVDVVAVAGGGATRAREALALRSGALIGKRVVVWQFSQRDLLFGSDGWRTVALDRAMAAPAAAPVGANEPVTVRAQVIATTPVPDLFDYPDCLIMVRYRPLEDGGPFSGKPFVVAHWGWREWQAQSAAGLRPGQVVELELGPLPLRYGLDRTCWHDDVGLSEAPWWPLEVREP